jgi:tetratricopeptide (TPR) repeat protein
MKSFFSYTPASNLMRSLFGALAFSAVAFTAGCDLDLQNPNDPTEQEVVTDAGGILAVAVGLQAQYSSSMLVYARAPSLVTDQWGTAARSLLADRSLLFGVDVLPDYGVVSGPFVSTYRIARSANILIDNAPQVGANRGVQVGAVALAKLLKGMALGNAALQYERLPLDSDVAGGSPQPRDAALAEVLRLLESARADLQGVTDAELGITFRSRGLDPGLDLRNTTDAMLARYYLFTGQYQQAITAADRVDLTTLSRFTFGNPSVNPVYSYSLGGAVYVAALKSFVDNAAPGDERPAFWVDVSADPIVGNPTDTLLLPFAAFAGRNDPIPVYMPDEMKLIKAEAHTRLGNFEQARSQINEVRTQSSSPVEEPVANLPALPASALDSEAELLSQIAYERQYELYWVGTRWADLRRLAPFAAAQPSISFLPFPSTECQVNPNANC